MSSIELTPNQQVRIESLSADCIVVGQRDGCPLVREESGGILLLEKDGGVVPMDQRIRAVTPYTEVGLG
jgi:hypothetical protein